MNPNRITPDYSAAAQIGPEDVAGVAALGYRAVMCNRPDSEEPGQPDFAVIEAEAVAQGLATAHVPVVSGRITAEDVAAFRAAIDTLPKPVLAYCRSGARCANLWQLAQ
jgi:sulfide:quinone oxidoreductase